MSRRFSIFSLVLIAFLLLLAASCVSIPPYTQIISQNDSIIAPEEGDAPDGTSSLTCSIAKIQKSLDTEAQNAITPPKQPLNPQNISLINWNIYKAQGENWAEDFRTLIKGQNLVLIQEAINQPKVTSLLQQQQPWWQLNTAFYYNGHATGVLTASSTPALFSCGLRTTEPLIQTPKTVLINLYPIANSPQVLLVANLHGINFTPGTETYAEQILAMSAIIEQHAGPVIVAGDFNSWSESRNEIVHAMAEKLALKSLTYTSHNRTRVFGHALDHVFYRGLEVISQQTPIVSSSDHNPILAAFRVAETTLVSQ